MGRHRTFPLTAIEIDLLAGSAHVSEWTIHEVYKGTGKVSEPTRRTITASAARLDLVLPPCPPPEVER